MAEALISRISAWARERAALGASLTYERTQSARRVWRLDYESGGMGWEKTIQSVPALDQRLDVNATMGDWIEVASVERVLGPRLQYRDDHRWWLRRLLYAVVTLGAAEGSPRTLNTIIGDLEADLTTDDVPWQIELWLNGLRLEDIEIVLGPGMLLRRPTARDFETGPIAMDPFFDDRAAMPDSILTASVALPSSARGSSAFVDALLDTLTLFRVSSVNVAKVSQITHSLRAMRDFSYVRQGWPTFSATLTAADADAIAQFVADTLPLVQEHQIVSTTAPTSGWIALTRYRDALGLPVANAATTAAVSALEAILLGKNERDELTRAFTQRTAALLSHFGHDPLEVAASAKRAYGVRSKYIHGANVKGEPSLLDALARSTVDMARQCLVAMLLLEQHGVDKDRTIVGLDKQLLCQSGREEMEAFCSRVTVPVASGS